MSPQPTSAMDPRLVIDENPTFSWRLQSRTAVRSAPLWLTNATWPTGAMAAAKVAFSPVTGLMTPRQLGPMTRTPCLRASSTTWRSSSAPSGPTSLNPAEMTTTARTPASPHWAMRAGTVGGGVTMTARSTGSGMAPISG